MNRPDKGTLAVDGRPEISGPPRDALARRTANLYRGLAILPRTRTSPNLMPGMAA